MSACGKTAQDLLSTVGIRPVPHVCYPAHSLQARSQACFRFCSSDWPRLSHFEEVKLIVSLIRWILQHLLKGFTACRALCQLLGNEMEYEEQAPPHRNSYQALKYCCGSADFMHRDEGRRGCWGLVPGTKPRAFPIHLQEQVKECNTRAPGWLSQGSA